MGRIQNAYESKFRRLLRQIGARRADQALSWVLNRAQREAEAAQISPGQSLERVYRRLSEQVTAFTRQRTATENPPATTVQPRFICDAGLGGLARWLRAAGYEAVWTPTITDDALVKEAAHSAAILLTTDSLLMERRLLRDGVISSVWVSPSLKVADQLTHVLVELKLPVREPRCMACGGQLLSVAKQRVADRIPPKTLRWLDDYFECQKCGKLFWHGTHWESIEGQLTQLHRPKP